MDCRDVRRSLRARASVGLAVLVATGFVAVGPARAARPGPAAPDDPPDRKPAVAGEIKGEPITIEEVEKAAAGELMNLEVQREKILETQLERMVASRLIALEAKARGLTENQLLQQEVFAKAPEPSAEEIESYYQASRDLMKEGQDKAIPRIKQALTSQRRQKVYLAYLEELKTKYAYRSFLEPVRVTVDAGTGPARGPVTAPVTIVEFSDFECPYCAVLSKTLADVLKKYPDNVRLVYRQFPLERIHPNAMKAAETSICALEQGKFWEMHDQLFKGGPLSEAELAKRAGDAGLAADRLQACLAAGKATERVRTDQQAGAALGISSTPSLFINGRPVRGAVSLQEITRVIDEELKTSTNRKALQQTGGQHE